MSSGFKGLWEAVFGWLAKPPSQPFFGEIIDFNLELTEVLDIELELTEVLDIELELTETMDFNLDLF